MNKKKWLMHRCALRVAGALLLLGMASMLPGCASTQTNNNETKAANDYRSSKPGKAMTNADWWPNRLDLRVLKENAPSGDPMDGSFLYAAAFSRLDLAEVKKDIVHVLKNSRSWWPADWGHYGGLMIRLAWHSAGTYRSTDGRGGSASGTIRFAPLNSWPDNANLDKARRLLWPVKKKYGRSLSWADLMILAGNVSFESMGFKTFGFGGGREDVYEPTDINWGPETEWLADERFSEDGQVLDKMLGASQMGLIYVNPEGPNGNPDPLLAAHHIRVTFARMGMNDEETVALIAGGHTLGKAHGAARAGKHVGVEPERGAIEAQGFGWKSNYASGKGKDTITSGIEGAWTRTPTTWSQGYFQNLFGYEWELIEGPGGGKQWSPKNAEASVPDAHVKGKMHKPMMLTTDLSLRFDPAYEKISRRFLENPEQFNLAFAKAWYKLTHRDMGPQTRLLGPEVAPAQLWQDPIPAVTHPLVTDSHIATLSTKILEAGLSTQQLVTTAWAAASTYRDTDKRGGANGARIRLAPQKDWDVNQPQELQKVLSALGAIQTAFHEEAKDGVQISMADLIVLAGKVAIENAAAKAGHKVIVPFAPGRTDATQDMTEVDSFAYLEPKSDGFRNYIGNSDGRDAAEALIEKADLLNLTAPEMTVLIGGLRAMGVSHDGLTQGFTPNAGALNQDFFTSLLDMKVEWRQSPDDPRVYEGLNRGTGNIDRKASAVDLIFGSNSQLRGLAEVYAADDATEKFIVDFIAAWDKVMSLDRFDLDAKRTNEVIAKAK